MSVAGHTYVCTLQETRMCVHTKSGNTSSSGGSVLTCSDSYKEHKTSKFSKLRTIRTYYVCTFEYVFVGHT